MQLFYNPEISKNTKQFSFDKTESRHIVKVLRKSEGDFVYITNGKGLFFKAEITFANDKKCQVTIKDVEEKEKDWKYNVHIAVAPTKLNDRFEWFLEKATEIGIDEITPLICDRSERKVLKTERMQKIIETALKQSLKYHLPILHKPTKFKDFIKQNKSKQCFIAHCEETDKFSLKNQLKTNTDVLILIGPEGDFTSDEISLALHHKYIPVSLGNSRLRTETAAVVATHTVALLNETEC